MFRNPPVSELSNRRADGGIQPGGPHSATQYTGADNVIPFPSGRRFSPDSQGSSPEPFLLTIDVREVGALFFVVGVALIPWLAVAGVVVAYLHFAT